MGSDSPLGVCNCIQRIVCTGKGNEKGVALRVNFLPIPFKEGSSQYLTLFGKHGGVLGTKPLKQTRTAFNVSKEKGNGSAGKVRHLV